MKVYIGIDPGITGAIAAISKKKKSHVDKIKIFDTPVDIIKKGKSIKKEYLPVEMANRIRIIINKYGVENCHIAIEKVHSMPKQGVASTFSFGRGYGIWLGIIATLHISFSNPTPQAWKKEMMRGMSDKDAARIRAQELFPKCATKLSLKKHIGRADALLIAEYARRMKY